LRPRVVLIKGVMRRNVTLVIANVRSVPTAFGNDCSMYMDNA